MSLGLGPSQINGLNIQQQNQMIQRKVMMDSEKIQTNEKNKGRAKGQMIGVAVFFVAMIVLLIVLKMM